jgi:hypothetical protein
MFGWKRGAILRYNLQARLAWHEKNKAGGYAFGRCFGSPTIAVLTLECYQCALLGFALGAKFWFGDRFYLQTDRFRTPRRAWAMSEWNLLQAGAAGRDT